MRCLSLVVAAWIVVVGGRAAAAPVEEAWLDGLYDRVASDLRAGRPLVVGVHLPLCDNRVLGCGNARLGDGDSLRTNLYWATSGGLDGWLRRRGSGWRRVARIAGSGDLLETAVWHRRVSPSGAFRQRRVAPFDVYLVAHAWRGTSIDRAVDAYLADLFGTAPRTITLDDGTSIAAGGAAHVVSFLGHNRWMDYPGGADATSWAALRQAGAPIKGTVAIACQTAQYLGRDVPAPQRVPLLMTSDFLFAGGHGFEGAVSAFASGGDLAGIRDASARAYAAGQGKPVARVRRAFVNPADRRWPSWAAR